MSQSWYRRGKKKIRENEKRKKKRQYYSEWIERHINTLIFITFILLIVAFILVLIIAKADWIVAALSLELMIISIVNSKELNDDSKEYKKFYLAILGTSLILYFLVLVLYKLVPDCLNGIISRYISAGCVVFTFIYEMYKPYKRMQTYSKQKSEELIKEIK